MFHIQSETIVPARRKVSNLDLVVTSSFSLTPQQQSFFCAQTLLVDVTDGKAQNEGPDETKNDFPVAVDNVFCADIRQLDAPAFDKV